MKFSKKFLLELLEDGETAGDKLLSDTIIEKHRWNLRRKIIFSYGGKFYQSIYSEGSTEHQDEYPWQYDPDEIECPEVRLVEKVTIVYEEI